jgi:AraC-like DNA-binding protein
VQRLLLRVLPEGGVSVHRLAKMMNQSARTLQRRLGDHGLTWQMLLDRTREQLARQYLRDPALSVCEVAMMLGYSDQSAFTKAFKRWTADTPQAWRSRGAR